MKNSFLELGGGALEFSVDGAKKDVVAPGVYSAVPGPFGRRFLYPKDVITDKLVALQSKETQLIVKDIASFLNTETKQAFKNYEMLYRRGILVYGPPGTGKTTTVLQITQEFVKRYNGVVLLEFPIAAVADWIRYMRSNDKSLPIMLVMEEFDDWIDRDERSVLALLDGLDSCDNIVVLATTNYIDEVPNRIKNRPSRFARVVEVGYPTVETRLAFLKDKVLPEDQKKVDIVKLAEMTEGLSIDHLKDVIVSLFCFKTSLDEAVSKVKEMQENADDEDDY